MQKNLSHKFIGGFKCILIAADFFKSDENKISLVFVADEIVINPVLGGISPKLSA